MRQNKNALTNAEWIMMEALWGKEPQILSEIIESIGDKVDWNYQTYASYLKVLYKKGFIEFNTRGRNKYYFAAVELKDCIEAEKDNIINKMSFENAQRLMLCMAKESGLSKEAQKQLEMLIEQLSEKGE